MREMRISVAVYSDFFFDYNRFLNAHKMPPINFYYCLAFMINCCRFFTKQMSYLMKKEHWKQFVLAPITLQHAADAQINCMGGSFSFYPTHAVIANVQLWVFCCLYCKLISNSELIDGIRSRSESSICCRPTLRKILNCFCVRGSLVL